MTDRLEHATVALGALIGGDNTPDRILLGAHAGQPESYCHDSLSEIESKTDEGE
jgi:hypothetical protein